MNLKRLCYAAALAFASSLFACADAAGQVGRAGAPAGPPRELSSLPGARESGGAGRGRGQPITILTKDGGSVRAGLIGGDDDSIRVEIDGVERDIPWDEMAGFRAEPRLYDKYFNIPFDDEKARLDNVAIELSNDPAAKVRIVVYVTRKAGLKRADHLAARARDYLTDTRGVDSSRVNTVNGGFKSRQETELWIVPPEAAPPPQTSNNNPAAATAKKARRQAARPRRRP